MKFHCNVFYLFSLANLDFHIDLTYNFCFIIDLLQVADKNNNIFFYLYKYEKDYIFRYFYSFL